MGQQVKGSDGKYRGLQPRNAAECATGSPHPFHQQLNFTKLDILKYVINAFWLFPLRFFLIVVPTILCGILLCTIVAMGIRSRVNEPLTGWRKFALQKIGIGMNKVLLFGLGFHCVKITGRPDPTQAPIMIAAPHTSLLDLLLVCQIVVPTMVSRGDAANIPIFGPLVTHTLKTIFVSREDRESRQRCGEEIKRRANAGGDWPPVLIFPEGTTTNRTEILRFKSGAFVPQLSVQPVLIKYKNRLNTMVWTEKGVGVLMGLFLTVCNFHNSAEIEYLPVYHPNEEEKSNPSLYADNVRAQVCRAINFPQSEYMVEDLLFARHSEKLGLHFEAGLVGYGKKDVLGLPGITQMKQYLNRFASMDRDKDGLVTVEDIALFLRLPQDNQAQAMFKSLNPDSDGLLRFREYVCSLVAISRPLLQDESLLLQMFEFFDSDRDSLVTMEDLYRLIIKDTSLSSSGAHELPDGPWNFEAFKSLLQANPEYLLLFNESQNAATSCPPDNAQEHALLATGSNLSSPNVTPAHLSSPANGTNSASRTLREANNDIIVVID